MSHPCPAPREAEHERRRRERQRAADDDGLVGPRDRDELGPRPDDGLEQLDAAEERERAEEERADDDLSGAQAERVDLERLEALERQLQALLEEQEEDPDLRELVVDGQVLERVEPARPQRRARDEVAEDRRPRQRSTERRE